jgi:hypothetical protein
MNVNDFPAALMHIGSSNGRDTIGLIVAYRVFCCNTRKARAQRPNCSSVLPLCSGSQLHVGNEGM